MVKKTKKNYPQLWQQCLATIRNQYPKGEKYDHWFSVWFGDVALDAYDPDKKQLRLRVPSRYVYEFLDSYMLKPLRAALQSTFGEQVALTYRIMPQAPSFADMAAYLQCQSGGGARRDNRIHLDNAKERLEDGLRYFLKDKPMEWVNGYEDVVKFLTDNDRRGLLIVGTPGLGKSLIACRILPVLLANGVKTPPVVRATDLRKRLEELKRERVVIIDDLGKEPRKHYGDTDQSFYELCDNSERTGAILIITTNLATTPTDDPRYSDDIETRYGEAVLSRLNAITHVAVFEGNGLREEEKQP